MTLVGCIMRTDAMVKDDVFTETLIVDRSPDLMPRFVGGGEIRIRQGGGGCGGGGGGAGGGRRRGGGGGHVFSEHAAGRDAGRIFTAEEEFDSRQAGPRVVQWDQFECLQIVTMIDP